MSSYLSSKMEETTPLLAEPLEITPRKSRWHWRVVAVVVACLCLVVITTMALLIYGVVYYGNKPLVNYVKGTCLVANCSYQEGRVTLDLQPVAWANRSIEYSQKTQSSAFCQWKSGNQTCYYDPVNPEKYCSFRKPDNTGNWLVGTSIPVLMFLGLFLIVLAWLLNGSIIESSQMLVDFCSCPTN